MSNYIDGQWTSPFLEISRPEYFCLSESIVSFLNCDVASSCWNQMVLDQYSLNHGTKIQLSSHRFDHQQQLWTSVELQKAIWQIFSYLNVTTNTSIIDKKFSYQDNYTFYVWSWTWWTLFSYCRNFNFFRYLYFQLKMWI